MDVFFGCGFLRVRALIAECLLQSSMNFPRDRSSVWLIHAQPFFTCTPCKVKRLVRRKRELRASHSELREIHSENTQSSEKSTQSSEQATRRKDAFLTEAASARGRRARARLERAEARAHDRRVREDQDLPALLRRVPCEHLRGAGQKPGRSEAEPVKNGQTAPSASPPPPCYPPCGFSCGSPSRFRTLPTCTE